MVTRIYNELIKFNNKITNNPVKKLAKDLFRYFTKGDIQMAKHMKDSHHHYLLGNVN